MSYDNVILFQNHRAVEGAGPYDVIRIGRSINMNLGAEKASVAARLLVYIIL